MSSFEVGQTRLQTVVHTLHMFHPNSRHVNHSLESLSFREPLDLLSLRCFLLGGRSSTTKLSPSSESDSSFVFPPGGTGSTLVLPSAVCLGTKELIGVLLLVVK